MASLNIKTNYFSRLQLWVKVFTYAECSGEDSSLSSRLILSLCALDGHTALKY